MKRFSKPITYCMVISFLLCSCQKSPESQPSSANTTSSVNSTDKASSLRDTLTLRQGPDKGQDVFVYKEAGVKSSNFNYVPELNANAWSTNGNTNGSGSFIRFDGLSAIPDASIVISAKLYLYGLSSSLSTPQGNYGDNACYIKRVVDPWDESTLVFSPKLPRSTNAGQAILPASTSHWNYNPVVDVTAMVAHMIAYPNENYGFSINLITQQKYRSIVFGSSEQPDKSLRPKLVVVYEANDNPLAGPYLWDFTRWPCQDSTSVLPTFALTANKPLLLLLMQLQSKCQAAILYSRDMYCPLLIMAAFYQTLRLT